MITGDPLFESKAVGTWSWPLKSV